MGYILHLFFNVSKGMSSREYRYLGYFLVSVPTSPKWCGTYGSGTGIEGVLNSTAGFGRVFADHYNPGLRWYIFISY